MSITAMKQALEALLDSVDLVREEYENAVNLYGSYPTRAARISGLLAGLKAHEDAITSLRTAIAEAEKAKPVAYIPYERGGTYHSSAFINASRTPLAGWVPTYLAAGAQPAPKQEQEPVAWRRVDTSANEAPSYTEEEPSSQMRKSAAECGECYEPVYLAPPQAQPAKPLTCTWTQEEDDDNMPGTYDTACGELWSFVDGGPAENNYRFCHGCGKLIEIKESS